MFLLWTTTYSNIDVNNQNQTNAKTAIRLSIVLVLSYKPILNWTAIRLSAVRAVSAPAYGAPLPPRSLSGYVEMGAATGRDQGVSATWEWWSCHGTNGPMALKKYPLGTATPKITNPLIAWQYQNWSKTDLSTWNIFKLFTSLHPHLLSVVSSEWHRSPDWNREKSISRPTSSGKAAKDQTWISNGNSKFDKISDLRTSCHWTTCVYVVGLHMTWLHHNINNHEMAKTHTHTLQTSNLSKTMSKTASLPSSHKRIQKWPRSCAWGFADFLS